VERFIAPVTELMSRLGDVKAPPSCPVLVTVALPIAQYGDPV